MRKMLSRELERTSEVEMFRDIIGHISVAKYKWEKNIEVKHDICILPNQRKQEVN